MAIYGYWQDCGSQVQVAGEFVAGFDFVRQVMEGSHPAMQWLQELPVGESRRVDLDGDRLFAMLQHSLTKPRAEQQMETHRRYADIQVVVAGSERMELAQVKDLTVTTPYDTQKELVLYSMPNDTGTTLVMENGCCAVLFPTDVHAPLLAPAGVSGGSRRVVVKVLLPSQ
jgi:YhcH/YjgK/YiaL family protein